MGLFGIFGKKKEVEEKSNYSKSRKVGLDTAESNYGWYKCVHCGKSFRKGDIQIDHILPRSSGGKDNAENLQCLCRKCNQKKSNNTSQTKADLKRRAAQLARMKRSEVLRDEIKKERRKLIDDCKKLGMSESEIRQLLVENGIYN